MVNLAIKPDSQLSDALLQPLVTRGYYDFVLAATGKFKSNGKAVRDLMDLVMVEEEPDARHDAEC